MDDEVFYEAVANELEREGPKRGLWTKALVAAGGVETVARIHYIEMRKDQLMESAKEAADEEAAAVARQFKEDWYPSLMVVAVGVAVALVLAAAGLL